MKFKVKITFENGHQYSYFQELDDKMIEKTEGFKTGYFSNLHDNKNDFLWSLFIHPLYLSPLGTYLTFYDGDAKSIEILAMVSL